MRLVNGHRHRLSPIRYLLYSMSNEYIAKSMYPYMWCAEHIQNLSDDVVHNSFESSSLSLTASISVRFSLDVLNKLTSCQN